MTHPKKRDVHEQAMELNKIRKECNTEILRKLTDYLRNNPTIRFNQALYNMDIITEENSYYTEPSVVLKRIK